MVTVKINFGKKDFVWIGLFVILISVGFGIAFGGTVPSEMGHSAGELAAPVGCSSGHSLIWDGSSWDCGLGAAGEDRVVVGSFGVWNDRDSNGVADSVSVRTTYTASTDGIVVAHNTGTYAVTLDGYTPSGTLRSTSSGQRSGQEKQQIIMPVKAGDTWRIESYTDGPTNQAANVYWMPIESAGMDNAFVSPWYSLTKDQVISVPHTLGTKDVVMNVQIKTSDGKIHLFRRGDNCNIHHSATYVDFTTDSSLTLTAGGTGIGFTDHCVNIVTGEVRVLMQKI